MDNVDPMIILETMPWPGGNIPHSGGPKMVPLLEHFMFLKLDWLPDIWLTTITGNNIIR